ncbi:AMP deaminase-like [Iris pallida]|uniref:AMP deaminase-like n=1 Tax=Iris pallida TaxID=29817 RepID=A0AAX6E3R3_IRIPA|nr:AMP deaminase-like [Iris pallida]
MDTSYTLHLALAALVGASFVAVSGYYVHRKTLAQLIEFARVVESSNKNKDQHQQKQQRRKERRHSHGSASLPDFALAAAEDGEGDGEEEEEAAPSLARNGLFAELPIPAGLPRLHTGGNKQNASANSNKRTGNIMRPTSPKSPGASASAFESVEGSDDDDTLPADAKLDDSYLQNNGDLGPGSLFQTLPDGIAANGDTKPLAASSSMIRSHSVSGDLHGVQPDPIAADILRKEPEQETFVRMKISPRETPSADEAEVYKIIQDCLELRERYVFKEENAPWEKEIITDPSTPKPNLNPFAYSTEQRTDHFFQMVDGVVHVYRSKESMERVFPVADATTFFTDLHRILRVTAAGNIRTLCHHRLNLLEQKFNLHLMLNADKEFLAQKTAPHRDFYNVRKVDTHVHHSACMNQKHLLRFIKSKLRKEPDEVVIFRDGTYLTLKRFLRAWI